MTPAQPLHTGLGQDWPARATAGPGAARGPLWPLVLGLVLGLGVVLVSGAYLMQRRDAALNDAGREVRNVALTLANWADDSFRSVELMQSGLLDWIRAENITTPEDFTARLSTRRAHQILTGRMGALPWVRRLFLLDDQGRSVASSMQFPAPPIVSAGRDFFELLRGDARRESALSTPWKSQLDGQWYVYLSRRISSPTGQFLGVIGAAIDISHYERIFSGPALGPHSAIALARRDGMIMARHPREEALIGTRLPLPGPLNPLLANPEGGVEQGPSLIDGQAQIRGIRALQRHPLAIVATRTVEEVLAPWREEVRRQIVLVLLLEGLILAGMLLVSRQNRQRQTLAQLQLAQREAEARLVLAEERESVARAVAGHEAALSAIFDNGAAGMTERDALTGRFLRVNRAYCAMTGYSESELLASQGPPQVLHPEDRDSAMAGYEAGVAGSGNWDAELRFLRKDGVVSWVRISVGVTLRDQHGHPLRTIAIVQDVSETRRATNRLRDSEAILRMGLQVGHIGTFRREGIPGKLYFGPEARALLGLPPGDGPLPMDTWRSTVLPEDIDPLSLRLEEAISRQVPEFSYKFRIIHPSDGKLRHFEARTRYDYDAEGQVTGSVGVVIDVTESREAEARIAHIAHHDALTDLPNRTLFRQRLEEALARSRRGEAFSVLCLDLDRFKEINDTLGHPVGDGLLRAVAGRLSESLRPADTLARLGGDEFAIIQSGPDQPDDAIALARRLVDGIVQPFTVDGHQLVIGTSIGIALSPGDGDDADTMLKAADMALYRAKAEGRGRWRFFESGMDARMQLRRALELDLRRGLDMKEFELFYQPIMDVRTRKVAGLEALLRWRHPERGLVPPDTFIPLAEEIGLIVPLGEWVLRRACAEAVGWEGRPKIAVNLSPLQIGSRGLVDAVREALAESGLEPDRLELEITETVMLHDTDATMATLHRLKSLGARIAMDDFGTGYSSLGYLRSFPFDKVKIDRSFIRDLGQSPQSAAIIAAVTGMCDGLDMTTTAEGVETEAQFQALFQQGCKEAQGYLFSKPRPSAEIPALLQQLAAAATRPVLLQAGD